MSILLKNSPKIVRRRLISTGKTRRKFRLVTNEIAVSRYDNTLQRKDINPP